MCGRCVSVGCVGMMKRVSGASWGAGGGTRRLSTPLLAHDPLTHTTLLHSLSSPSHTLSTHTHTPPQADQLRKISEMHEEMMANNTRQQVVVVVGGGDV